MRREANVIYEDRATSQVDEVSRRGEFLKTVSKRQETAHFRRGPVHQKCEFNFREVTSPFLERRDFDRSLRESTET